MITVGFLPFIVQGFWNPDEAVHINSADIENSTLIIGTHLIHISGLTDELYEAASQSAADSRQYDIYYKSEMADGTWFNITLASSIADISTAGTPVDNETINQLFLEYHTKSDGITYDLRNGQAVNIFNIRNPYELESMEELRPLKLQLDMLDNMESPGEGDKWCQTQIDSYFATDIVTEQVETQGSNGEDGVLVMGNQTEEIDETIISLDAYLSVLKDYGGGEEERSVVMSVMDSQDAKRRLIVCQIMYEKTYDMTVLMSGSKNEKDGEDMPPQSEAEAESESEAESEAESESETNKSSKPDGYVIDSQMIDAVYETLDNLNNSIISYEGKVLAEGDTIHSQVRYHLSNQLISDAQGLLMSECDKDVKKLLHLSRIMEGSVVNKEEELTLLEEELLVKGEQAYIRGLMAGENSAYQTAKGNHSANVLLKSIAGEYKGVVERLRNELEFFIDAKCMRMSNEKAQDYIKECLQKTGSYYGGIPSDGFYDDCKSSADSHVEWLNQKLQKLAAGAQSTTDADRLAMEKEELSLAYMKALDNNQLGKAKEIQEKLDKVSNQLSGIEEGLSEEYSQIQEEISKLEAEIQNTPYEDEAKQNQLAGELAEKQMKSAEIKSRMSDTGIGSLAAAQKADALNALNQIRTQGNALPGDLAALEASLSSLKGIMDSSYKVAFPAVKDIYSELVKVRDLNGADGLDDLILQVEEMILNNQSAYEHAMSGELDGKAALEIAAGLMGDQEGWSDEDTAVFMAAAGLCMGETDADLGGLTAGMALSEHLNQNPYVFMKPNTGGGTVSEGITGGGSKDGGTTGSTASETGVKYIAVDTLGRLVQMRYIWNQTKSQAILADGSKYYEFQSFSDRVRIGKAEADVVIMPEAALLNEVLYIPETYVSQEFGWECIYLPGCDYALTVNEEMKRRAEEMSAEFKEGGS